MNWFAYDYFENSAENLYWSSESTPPTYIKEIPIEIWNSYRPEKCNNWKSSDFIGGMIVHEEKICFFRIFNGGLDSYGRPGRWVLLVAEAERKNYTYSDVTSILECNFLGKLAKIPLPQFFDLSQFPILQQVPWAMYPPKESISLKENRNIENDNDGELINIYAFEMIRAADINAVLWIKKFNGICTADYRVNSIASRSKDLASKQTKTIIPKIQQRPLTSLLELLLEMRKEDKKRHIDVENHFASINKGNFRIIVLLGLALLVLALLLAEKL